MQGLDVEEVKLAGKPRVEIVKRTDKTIRYPTEARTLQQAIDMCVAGDHISILPGVYNESAVISVDLDLFREGQKGEVVFVSRHETTLLVSGCKVSLNTIGFCVEEGALEHHAMLIDNAEVEMEGCELFGGLYACFACSDSKINARMTRFHSAYSYGVTLLNSSGSFTDCFMFKNKEHGFCIGGGTSKAHCCRCRMSDNACHGLHVHSGADVEMELSEVLRNGQHGIAITGYDEQFVRKGTGEIKWSCAQVKKSKIRNNEWNAVFILDGSATLAESDLRKNGRGALTLTASKAVVQHDVDRLNLPYFDVPYYNTFEQTGHVELLGDSPPEGTARHVMPGLRLDGQNEFTQPDRLPPGWDKFPKEKLVDLFKQCPFDVQRRLQGHPQGWHQGLQTDPQARIKIVAELRAWLEREEGNKAEEEIDLTVDEFLFPLGLGEFATKFKDIGCPHVRDIMAMNHYDLFNIGMKNLDDRKVLLSRLAVNLDIGAGPKYIKEMNLAALIESTKFQAKRGGSKGSFKEWRKLRPFLLERIGIGVAGVELDEKLRALYAEMDVDNTVGSEGIDADELRVGLQRFGINLAEVKVDDLVEEAIPPDQETLTFDRFCLVIVSVLNT